MKRSEMLNIIKDYLLDSCMCGTCADSSAENLLSAIEDKGMSPPPYLSPSLTTWEPEDV